MNEMNVSAEAQSVECPENAVVPVAVRKPVVVLLTTNATKGHQIRHWVVAGVTDLESGVLYAPMASSPAEAVDRAMEIVNFAVMHEDPRYLLGEALKEEGNAYVITYDIQPEEEVYLPLVWRNHPIRVVTMDSPVLSDARTVLCRYRGRMSKELRVYRGDLSEEVL